MENKELTVKSMHRGLVLRIRMNERSGNIALYPEKSSQMLAYVSFDRADIHVSLENSSHCVWARSAAFDVSEGVARQIAATFELRIEEQRQIA